MGFTVHFPIQHFENMKQM